MIAYEGLMKYIRTQFINPNITAAYSKNRIRLKNQIPLLPCKIIGRHCHWLVIYFHVISLKETRQTRD